MTSFRVLGLDAALARTGVALLVGDLDDAPNWRVDYTDVIATSARHDRAARLAEIGRAMEDILAGYPPTHAFIEKPGGWTRGWKQSSQVTVEALAQARAVMLAACRRADVPVEELPTNQVKATVVRQGASKQEILLSLAHRGLYDGGDEDIADAVAVAFAGAKLLWVRAVAGETRRQPRTRRVIRRART